MRITLSRALYALAKAVSKDITRLAMRNILVESDGTAVSTNGYVLLRTKAKVDCVQGCDPKQRFLTVEGIEKFKRMVGKKTLDRLLQDKSDPVIVKVLDDITEFEHKIGLSTFVIDTVDFQTLSFPDYRKIWPEKDKYTKVFLNIDALQVLIDARKAMPIAPEAGIEFYIPPEGDKGHVIKGILIRIPCPGGPIEGIIMPVCPNKDLKPPKKELK